MSTANGDYREWRPHPALAPFVACYWSRTDDGRAVLPHRVLPDGCVDVMFTLSDALIESRVIGAMTRAVSVPLARGRSVAARFRPGGAAAFLGARIDELTDGGIALADAWDRAGCTTDRIAAARGAIAAIEALERELLARTPRPTRQDALVLRCANAIAAAPEATSVARLAADLGVARQHLTREFRSRVGYGPKMLARVLRMQRVVAALGRKRDASLAMLAIDHGYTDQSHLANEVRALTGGTASAWLGER